MKILRSRLESLTDNGTKMKVLIGIVTLFIAGLRVNKCAELGYQDIIFVILSQQDSVHEKRALSLELNLKIQTDNASTIYLTHRDINHVGDWTIIPILERLWNLHKGKFIWMFFCADDTKINVTNIISTVNQYNSEETFIGRALQDSGPTIIHHFASISGFKYPLFSSGFGLSYKLIERLKTFVEKDGIRQVDFSIDASHEFALFMKNNLNGTLLVNNSNFCLQDSDNCATYVYNNDLCDNILDIEKIFFAVKTCKKFHKNRIPVVQATWAKMTRYITFFSDEYEEDIPTVKLDVPSSESGHCVKTQAILNTLRQKLLKNDLQWVVLTDDDTILSVPRIQRVVGCYNSDESLILGERYGYNVYSDSGYNYITGGGGVALSRNAVIKLTENNCVCPSVTAPDDMFLLGICALRLNITLVHIPLFHQARPLDYSHEYLKIGKPVSFHKHWMIDPIQIYKEWFESDDIIQKKQTHYEL